MAEFLAPAYIWIKATHVAAVIAWMAAMMYLPRLYIYHHQSAPGGEAEGYFIAMERRLLKGIMTPAMIVVWLLAIVMIIANPVLLSTPWFLVKLAAVMGITGIHGFYSAAQKKFATGVRPRTEKFWRFMNEAPFILMLVAVFLAVAKPF